MKNLFWRYGRKIKKWDDRLQLRSVIFCMVFCMILSGVLLHFAEYSLPVSEKPYISRCASVLLFGMMLSAVLIGIAGRQRRIRENLENRELLAHMIIDNGWFETDLKTNSRGEQDLTYIPRLYYWRRRSITYIPCMYYKKKGGKIFLTVKINMSRYQDALLNLEYKVETGLDCEILSKEYQKKWQYYEFICDVAARRINVEEMCVKDGCMRLMEHIDWDYSRHPHALIVGDTGSGKTFFLLSVIETLLKAGAVLSVVDAKNASVARLEAILPDVHYMPEGIGECIECFYEKMMERMAVIGRQSGEHFENDYRECGMRPHFLVIDEYVAYLEMLPKKEWEETVSIIKKIALLGRQAGFFLILTCQRPDAKYLPDGIRAQFGLRVALGRMDSSGYTMTFGSSDKTFIEKDIKGRGYVGLWNNVVTEFYAPFVPEKHLFYNSIKAAYMSGGTSSALP